MDLSKCFDTLDHEIMMNEVSKTISDRKVLTLIESFLKSGIMVDGAYESGEIGSPQGGVISPLLSNIYLNIFDQKMKTNTIIESFAMRMTSSSSLRVKETPKTQMHGRLKYLKKS